MIFSVIVYQLNRSSKPGLTADAENVSSTISNLDADRHTLYLVIIMTAMMTVLSRCLLLDYRSICMPRRRLEGTAATSYILVSWCALVSRITAAYYSCLLLEPRDAIVSSRHVIIRTKNIIHQNP